MPSLAPRIREGDFKWQSAFQKLRKQPKGFQCGNSKYCSRAKINYLFLNLDMSKEGNMRTNYRRKDLGEGVRGKHFAEFMKESNPLILTTERSKWLPVDESGYAYRGEPLRAAHGKKTSTRQD